MAVLKTLQQFLDSHLPLLSVVNMHLSLSQIIAILLIHPHIYTFMLQQLLSCSTCGPKM